MKPIWASHGNSSSEAIILGQNQSSASGALVGGWSREINQSPPCPCRECAGRGKRGTQREGKEVGWLYGGRTFFQFLLFLKGIFNSSGKKDGILNGLQKAGSLDMH